MVMGWSWGRPEQFTVGGPNREIYGRILSKCLTGGKRVESRVEREVILVLDQAPR